MLSVVPIIKDFTSFVPESNKSLYGSSATVSIGIDPGWRNMGVCGLDSEQKITFLWKVDVLGGNKTNQVSHNEKLKMLRYFALRLRNQVRSQIPPTVAIEQQMERGGGAKNVGMSWALWALLVEYSTDVSLVSPTSVKKRFAIQGGSYANNKLKSVEKFMTELKFPHDLMEIKLDDVADSYWLAKFVNV